MSKLVERLIIEIKDKYHLKWDEDVADYTNITASHLNRMKKREGQPNAANFVKLAITAGWTMEKANVILNDGIDALEIRKINEKLKKQNGFIGIALLLVTATLSVSLITLVQISGKLYIM
ncbi:MAG: hypothetical protein Q8M10_06705 [Methylotenera sp.]|jgi:hypothetical protein|uniref:hypothetical protein n=1 Tax=Methylotenera sp. TaxID=2051956 RepID=UPI00273102CA|nr:hypothetical protein [Methylotenera sp.]MDP1522830.1 hypothetical protein [Methylotenera sp.]